MIDKDVAIAKIDSIQRCLKRIQNVTGFDPESLENLDTQEIVILNLQRAIQSAIDLAAHVVAEEGWGVPTELRENFDILADNEILDSELKQNLRKMVGFRNIAVHEYRKIDEEILKSILLNNLKDLEDFYIVIITFYSMSNT